MFNSISAHGGLTVAAATARLARLNLDDLHLYSAHRDTTGVMLRNADNVVVAQCYPADSPDHFGISFPGGDHRATWIGPAPTARLIWSPVADHFGPDAALWEVQQ